MKLKLSFENVDIGHLNFNEICRFCLSGSGILLPIYSFKEGDNLHELPSQIKSFSSIEMEEGDGLPSMICHCCLVNLERSLDFKKQCEQADFVLRNFASKEKKFENDMQIKRADSNSMDLKIIQDEEEKSCSSFKDAVCFKEGWDEAAINTLETEKEKIITDKIDNDEKDVCNNTEGVALETDGVLTVHDTSDVLHNYDISGISDKYEDDMGDEPVSALQMEENMNDLEESTFGSEPFSLDLCSVRLRSECQGNPDSEDVVFYPTAQLTDEEHWSDSGSENSDDFYSVEPVAIHIPVGSNNCPACNKSFPNITDLQRHQLIHKQEPPYPCDYCDKEFDEKTLLKAHWRTHAKNKPHMCLTCGEAYMERPSLVKHFAVHDLIKPYHCPGCGKAFAYRSDLRKHAIIHTGARPFKCPVCEKTFTRSTNLNKHARVHSGRRPYPCEHCDKMFSSRGDLVRHAVIHTGEKPYACLICSLAFNRKDKLSRHERVHITDRPYVCSECPTSFHRKEELTKHCRFHHFKPDPEYMNSAE